MAARLAEEWFAICGGCEVTILDIGEPLSTYSNKWKSCTCQS